MGLIVRRQGVGTFVAERPETPLRCRGYRFADHMRALGRIPWTRTVSFDRVELDERIAKILGRDPGDAAYRWRLVHEADGAPVLAEEAWLPCVRFGSLSSADVETRELPDLIGAIAPAAVRRVKEELSALAAKREQAHALRVPLGTPPAAAHVHLRGRFRRGGSCLALVCGMRSVHLSRLAILSVDSGIRAAGSAFTPHASGKRNALVNDMHPFCAFLKLAG